MQPHSSLSLSTNPPPSQTPCLSTLSLEHSISTSSAAPSSDSVLRPQSPRNRCFDLERRRFCLCNLDPARNSHREQERDSEKRTMMISDGVEDDDLNNLRDALTLERRDGNVWGSTSFPTSASSSEFIGERRLSMYRSCFKLKLMEKLLGRRLGSQHKGFHGSLYGFHSQTPDQIVVAINVDKDMEVFL